MQFSGERQKTSRKHRRIYHWAAWGMPLPFELRKKSGIWQKCNLREVDPIIVHVSILYPLSIRKQHNSIALNIVEKRHSSPVIHIFYDHSVKYYVQMCRKITKIVATRCQILELKCTKFDFGWGSAPDPAGGAYSAPPDPLIAGFVECHILCQFYYLSCEIVKYQGRRVIEALEACASPRQYCLMFHFLKSS